MNLKDENKELRKIIKAYESYYGGKLISLCLLCGLPINTKDKVSAIHRKEFISRTIGHFHIKCWEKLRKKIKQGE